MKLAFKFLGVALLLLQASTSRSLVVQVALRSSWPAPPFLAEILETVSLENPNAFFTYLDRLTDPEALISQENMTQEAIHQAALQIAVDNGVLSEPGSLALVQMNLAMHAATPNLEAFYNYYADNHNDSRGAACGSWVDWYGEVVCDLETLAHLTGTEEIVPPTATPPQRKPKILPFDHIYPPPQEVLERPSHTAVFYASLRSPNFRELHMYLLQLANRLDPQVEYIFRHIPTSTSMPSEFEKNYLSGYGVALDLKVDYLAVNDRHEGTNPETEPGHEQKADPLLPLILSHCENTTAPSAYVPLTTDEFESLAGKATQIIAESTSPLLILTHLSQNLPKYAASIARRIVVNESIASELQNNFVKVKPGLNAVWVNGLKMEMEGMDAFGLLQALKKEHDVMTSLTGLGLELPSGFGLDSFQAFELLTHPAIAAAQKDSNVVDALLDASDRPEGGDVIVWWNDIEKDSRYARWNSSLLALLDPMYPSAMPSIKANLFNIVLVLDLSHTTSLNFIASPMTNIISRDFPLSFGLVPMAETDDGKKMARLFFHLIQNYGRKKTLDFLKSISQIQLAPQLQTPKLNWKTVREAYDELVEAKRQEKPEVDFPGLESIFDGKIKDDAAPLDKITLYSNRLGSTLARSPKGHAFFNGKHFDVDDDFLRNLQNEMALQMRFLQEKVYEGSLSDKDKPETMSNYFYDLPTTSKHRNNYIYTSTGSKDMRIVNLPEIFAKTKFRVSVFTYLYAPESESISESLYIVTDLDNEDGLALVKEAVSSLTPDSKTRISFIHNPTIVKNPECPTRSAASWLFAHLHMRQLLETATPSVMLSILGGGAPEPSAEFVEEMAGSQVPLETNWDNLNLNTALKELTGGFVLGDIMPEEYANYVKTCRLISREFHLLPGQTGLVVNGRVVGPIPANDFHVADFKALEDYEFRKRTEPVMKALQDVVPWLHENKYAYAEIVSMASSVVASTQKPEPSESGLFDTPPKPRERSYQLLDSEYTSFQYGDKSTALYHVAVLLDPLSETAQKWSSLLSWLLNLPDIFIEVHLNPGRYNHIPLKRFYRYNLIPWLSFDEEGREIPSKAVFEDMPVDLIYTLAMNVPTSWHVRPHSSLSDLNNIQLGKLFPEDTTLEATFELDYIVTEGHTQEVPADAVPRGVQLQKQ